MNEFDINAEAANPGTDDQLSQLLAGRESRGEAYIQPGGYDPSSTQPDSLSNRLAWTDATGQAQPQLTPEQMQALLSMLLSPGGMAP